MNIENQFEKADYVSPKCKIAVVKSCRVMCASPYGEAGIAGAVFDSGNINDYSDDLL